MYKGVASPIAFSPLTPSKSALYSSLLVNLELASYDLAFGIHLVVEEERLFDGAHVDLRVLVEVMVERGRPRLLRAYYEEVGHRHLVTSPATPRKNALFIDLDTIQGIPPS